MSRSGNRTRTLSLLALAFLLPLTASADVVERTFDVGRGGTLTLDTDAGSLDIRSAPGDQLRVRIERDVRGGADETFELRFEQDGDNLRIEGERPEGNWSWFGSNKYRIRFEIVVPEQYNLDLATAGGSIKIAELEGDVACKTSGGSITVDDIEGQVDCRTSGGSIDIGRIEGSVVAKTSGGSISIDRSGGSVLAKTSGGSIAVNEVLGSIDATTSGGSVRAKISRQPLGDCRLSTSGGKVEVELAEGIAVDLDAKTSGGRVRLDVPVTVHGDIGRSSVRGQINGGGPELYLRSSGGSIYVKSL